MQTRRSRTLALVISVAALLGARPGPTLGQTPAPFDYAKILRNRPLPPTNYELLAEYSPYRYSTAGVGLEPTEEQAFALWDIYLQESYLNQNPPVIEELRRYSEPEIKQKVPTPALRAALLALDDTLASPAVDFVFDAKTPAGLPQVKEIRFANSADAPTTALYSLIIDEQTQQMSILFSPDYSGENPFLFSPVLARLLLEQSSSTPETDHNSPYYQTLVAAALEDLVYLQQLAHHPELAKTGSSLSLALNLDAAIRFNSGLGSHLGLYATNGNAGVVGPLGKSWYAFHTRRPSLQPVETPGNPLLARYLRNIQEPGNPPPPPADFNKAVLDWIDQNQGAPSAVELVRAAMALELDVSFVRQ